MNTKVLGLATTLLVCFSVVFAQDPVTDHSSIREPSPQCDPGEEGDCSKCYDVLANEVVVSDRNRFNLQQAFFPPNDSNPVFVAVTYYFIRNPNGPTNYSVDDPKEFWFWTQSTFYLFQPIASLQYTSLLFSDTKQEGIKAVSLYLQPKCAESNTDMKRLLTQRLKLYAAKQSIAASINDDYSAKGESFDTLLAFHNSSDLSQHLSNYTIAIQIVFPLLTIFFLGILLHTLIENNKLHFVRFYKEGEKQTHKLEDIKTSTVNMSIYIMVVCSYMFVVYVIILDCIAVNKRSFFVREEIYHPNTPTSEINKFELEFAIPPVMLVQDLLVFLTMFSLSFMKLSECWSLNGCFSKKCWVGKKLKWYNIIAGPVFCIIIHSYHILVGFIHSPHHATSILVFYGLILITFILALKSMYHHLFKWYIYWRNDVCCFNTFCLCCGCDVKNGVENDRKKEKCCHLVTVIFLYITAIFTGLVFVYIAFLFILVPINNVIDDAPDRILNINQTILILFGAAITYRLYKSEKFETILDYLVKAADRKIEPVSDNDRYPGEEQKISAVQNREWEKNTRGQKRKAIASIILRAIYKSAGDQDWQDFS